MRCLLPVRLSSAFLLVAVGFPAWATDRFDCVIQPSETVLLGTHTTGILSKVTVGRGEQVLQGQIVAQLDARVEEATVALHAMRATDTSGLDAQKARLELSRQRLARVQQLLRRGAGTQQAFDEASAEFAVNNAELKRIEMAIRLSEMERTRAEAALALRTIESPVNGIVTERVLGPGEFVNQDVHVLKIAVLDPLFVEAYLPIDFFAKLALGEAGLIEPMSGGVFEGRVDVIDSVFDATSNTFGVRLALRNPNGKLPAGQRCFVQFGASLAADD